MQQHYIEVTGARKNNLKNISLKIPKQKITVFTGVSGAGKSSIVFDTIAAESQRQLNEMFGSFIRNRLPKYGQPNVDSINNLSTAVIIDQKAIRGNSRSTVGTITDIYSLFRLLYSRIGEPSAGYSNAYSFNDPEGMCPRCDGLGEVKKLDLDKLLDTSKSLNEGPINFPGFSVGGYWWEIYANSNLFDNDKKLANYTKEEWQGLLHEPDNVENITTHAKGHKRDYEGLVDRFNRLYINRDTSSLSEKKRKQIKQVLSSGSCPLCEGSRLSQAALESTINSHNIAQLAAMEVRELIEVVRKLQNTDDTIALPIISEITKSLQYLITVGLGYLTLDRPTPTLSGGESQRIKIVKRLGSSLSDMLYIFDEPTVGLHPRDVQGLIDLLQELRDKGNTVLVVEHDHDVIKIADHVVDVGPRAGKQGGEIVYQGSIDGLYQAESPTGRQLRQEKPIKSESRQPTGQMKISNATLHNLKNITVSIPKGVLTAVSGVAGAGKSTLMKVFLQEYPEAIIVDQSAVGRSSRSILATYSGLMDEIRKLFSKSNDVSKSLFSFNSDGSCPKCGGRGVIYTDLAFMESVESTCEACNGKRYSKKVLQHKFRGQSISDVLKMTASEAANFFEDAQTRNTLRAINAVGLGYLRLGQTTSSLSGGECQRLKLASELHKSGEVYVLDEPTTGLHRADLERLLSIINRLVDEGNSVIVIEHNLDIVKNADWVIDLGPEGGAAGGQILFEGTPAQLLDSQESITATFLRKSLASVPC
ncbi:ATP-binding cassette domain-containing protein [Fodinibius halophilus]|uniref:UvrABC system protein A n=1 Tax=Fodinibius halophilus TaxID=1736908 RepID=A0A6M1ST22_9BACT|nr:excinuclease ABC subunit UvrA [Fodinibius halophilus]NGP87078.1 excinuclease ABC subunit UvrA [Fodinibius halophilus]